MREKKYRPVSCDFYDQLEIAAMHERECTIVLKSSTGEQQRFKGKIKSLYARDHVEYALMDDGTELRLDQILSVDGIPLKKGS